MKLTIIMICKNSEKTIRRALESVRKQTVSPYEFIVIDGDSTDRTIEILKTYKDIISILVSEPDDGPADAQNKAIALANGSLVTFLYADDYLYEEHVEKIICATRKYDYDFMYSDMYYVKNNRIIKKSIPNKRFNWTVNYRMPNLNFPTFVYKRRVFESVGCFDTKYKVAPDYQHVLRMHKSGLKGLYFSNCTYCFQLGGNAHSNLKKGLREVRDASISFGGSEIIAYLFFVLNLVRSTYVQYRLNRK